jgi:PAS domain S-box-containing protein
MQETLRVLAEYNLMTGTSPPQPSSAVSSPANLLIVDDTPANLSTLRAVLDELGENLVEAGSGEEALRRVQEEDFAVVLLDVRMPMLDGFETARRMRRIDRAKFTPIIFVTAADIDRKQLEEGYSLGAVDFLAKPFLPEELRAKVRGLVQLDRDRQNSRQEAELLSMLVQGTTDYAIFMLDVDGRVRTWNAGAERLKGYQAQEIIGEHFSRFYPEEAIRRGWPQHELDTAAVEGRFEDEGWRLRKDGSRFWANVVITALRDAQGTLRGFSKVTRDLTDRREAEEALRESEERFRLLVDDVQDYAIFLLDPEGRVASWNPGAERIKQYRASEIIGQHFSRFYPRDAVERGWPTHALETARQEGRFADEGWRVRQDGSRFWASVVITALRDPQGHLRGFSKITRDVTERKQSEDNARRLMEEATARRIAEENVKQIQEQRERLHVTLASIGDGVITTDGEGRIEFLNPVAEQLLGWTTVEAAGRPLTEIFRIVHEETRAPVDNPALRALRDGTIVGLANHTILIARDGVERPIGDCAAPIRDGTGRVIGSVLVFRDCSERLRIDQHRAVRLAVTQALVEATTIDEAADRLLRAVGENLRWEMGYFWRRDPDREVLDCQSGWRDSRSPAAEFDAVTRGRVFAKGEGLPGRVWESHANVWVVDVTRQQTFFRAPAAAREGLHSAFACPVAAGEKLLGVIEFFSRRTVEPDADLLEMMGSVAAGFGQFIERRRAEAALRESQAVYRAIGESIDYGVWVCDQEGRNVYASDSFLRLVGLTQEECSALGWTAVLHPEDLERTVAAWQECVRTGEMWDIEHRFRGVDGRWQHVLARGVPVRNERGETTAWAGINLDIQRLKQVEEQLRASDRRKDEFLATLAHELRNPLAPIANAVQLLQRTNDLPPQIREVCDVVDRQVRLLIRLVDELLELSRITSGKIELRRQRIELARVVADAIDLSRPLISAGQHRISVDLPPESLWLDADPVRLSQVVTNLLNNSAKYMDDGGQIVVSLRRQGDSAVLSVRDTGIGIPAEMLPRIFDMFSQADQARRHTYGGLGIGLALARNLVQMHGGRIEAHSAGTGQGSEFVVFLPLSPQGEDVAETPPESPQPRPLVSRKILIVDDNRAAALVLARLLEMLGQDVQQVESATAALDALRVDCPDVIFSDIGMPDVDGYELARRIHRTLQAETPYLVALTGYGQESDKLRAKEAGFHQHLVKPVSLAALEQLLGAIPAGIPTGIPASTPQ